MKNDYEIALEEELEATQRQLEKTERFLHKWMEHCKFWESLYYELKDSIKEEG